LSESITSDSRNGDMQNQPTIYQNYMLLNNNLDSPPPTLFCEHDPPVPFCNVKKREKIEDNKSRKN
jgi:hypothetical protein